MSNDHQKADQIAFHFYTKLFHVVNQARATAEPRTQGKVEKWFNLETQDSDLFTKEAREPYKNISQARPPGPPPLEIQVVLTIPELAHNQVLVYLAPDSSRARIEPTPKFIVLETFTLTFTPHNVDPEDVDVALPTIYKHGISLFRSLYSLLRVLPVWKLCKRLKRRVGRNSILGVQLRVRPTKESSKVLAFDMPPSPSLSTPFATQTHAFSKVPHPLGSLALTVRYLSTPEFHLEELESVLSSRFISQDLDGAEGFVPTLTKNHNRDSSIISTSSTTNTRSPPKNIIARAVSTGPGDVADRFILPARTVSTGSGSGAHQIQPARQTATGDFVGYGAPTAPAAVAHSPPSGLAISRLRKESMGSSGSSSFRDNISHNPNPSLSSLSSSPTTGPMAIRKPNPTPVNPFKSNTVLSSSTAGSSSSPSLSIRQGPHTGSPLSTGLAMGASGHGHSRSTSVSSVTVPPGAGTGVPSSHGSRHPPSPIGMGFAPGSRPSPSSQTDRRPGTAGSTGSGGSALDDTKDRGGEGAVAIPTRKRYSSSFGHRYTGSVGSQGVGLDPAGSGQGGSSGRGTPASGGNQPGLSGLGIEGVTAGGGEREGTMTSSLLSQNAGTDDDDISVFVQDIDSRKPLSGRWKEKEDRDRRAGSSGSGRSPERRRSALAQPLQREDTVRETYRQPLSMRGRFGAEATITSPPAPSAPGSRFSTATGSSSTTVTQGSTATVTPSTKGTEPEASTSPPASSVSPTRGPMLTSRGEVDERLRKMNETFLKSLEGIPGAGTNEAKRKERERKRERERERERNRDRISRKNSGEDDAQEPSTSPSPVTRDDNGSAATPFPVGRPPLSFRGAPLAGSPTVTPATPVAISGNGREDRGGHPNDDEGSGGRWVPYSRGMGLRRPYGEGEGEGGGQEGNASMLSQGGSTGQGSEEVIGKMDFLYEGPRTKDAYYDRR